MRLKLYRAPDMRAAMQRIRAELGEEALIVASRRTTEGIEVTAALEPQDPEPVARPPGQGARLQPLSPSVPEPVAPAPAAARQPARVGLDQLARVATRAREPEIAPARRAALAYHGVSGPLASRLARGDLADRLAEVFRFAPAALAAGAAPLLLFGPPGAGKTLSVVRLATRLVLAGVAPMVITTDGKRAGAVEQLAAFTRLLGITLIVANQPVILARALGQRPVGAPVLIDTPGADPFDPAQAEELAALRAVAAGDSALVLPAGIDPAEAADLACAFAEAGATQLIATRLDIARRLGGVLQAAAAADLALAEAGIGPGAADGMVPLAPGLLADRLLRSVPEPTP